MALADHNILALPPERSARIIALSALSAATKACDRFNDPEDSEALHDFRVALRKLRSMLNGYEPFLKETVSKKLRRRVKMLARATNEGRDAEVKIEWLREQRSNLQPREMVGLAWLIERLEGTKRTAYRRLRERVRKEFSDFANEMREALSKYTLAFRIDNATQPLCFGAIAGAQMKRLLSSLKRQLDATRAGDHHEKAHDARLDVKRLRYLLEPIRSYVPTCKPTVAKMKQLQDLLGRLHDAQILSAEVASAIEVAAAERARTMLGAVLNGTSEPMSSIYPDERFGLLAIIQILADHEKKLIAELHEEWLSTDGDLFLAEARCLAQKLAQTQPETGSEESSPAKKAA